MTDTFSSLYAVWFKDKNGAFIKALICLTKFNIYAFHNV
jgi:hypothetical protein